jgi:hypothetical protein
MATEYINATAGLDANSGASPALAWQSTQKANTSATTNDTIQAATDTYNANGTGGYGQTFHSLTRPLTWTAATTGGARLTNTAAGNPVCFVSALGNGVALNFNGIVFDANNFTQYAFSNADMGANVWNITWTSCEFKNPLIRGSLLIGLKAGAFVFSGCTYTVSTSATGGSGVVYGMDGDGATLGASAVVSITHTNPIINITSNTITAYGIYQDVSAVPTNAVTYVVDGLSGQINVTDATHFSCAVFNKISGVTIKNSANLTVACSTTTNSAFGFLVVGFSALYVNTSPVITNNAMTCVFPSGFGIALGNPSTANFVTGGTLTGNNLVGTYYASSTPHGIAVGMQTSVATFAGNTARGFYVNFIASLTTSGTGKNNISYDSYGADFYAKGCTAFTFTANTAVQTGKYARRNLAPFAIDSQGGVVTVATTFSNNTFICAEPDITRINALFNITVNSNGTVSGNTYYIPDTIADSAQLFWVGGSEGNRGGTGYTITQWRTGTAGSVSATNGTGTIAVSGETIIKLPLAQLQIMAAGGSNPIYRR